MNTLVRLALALLAVALPEKMKSKKGPKVPEIK